MDEKCLKQLQINEIVKYEFLRCSYQLSTFSWYVENALSYEFYINAPFHYPPLDEDTPLYAYSFVF